MPTPRKNSPSRMPRNGSMSISSWWRKLDSDSSTPARNAPIAIDRPLSCITSAAPSTTSSAAAVITSRACALARMRNIGLSSQRPAAKQSPRWRRARSRSRASARPRRLRRARRQERHQRQQRHDGEVFEQQDRHQPLPLRRRGVAALLQDLHRRSRWRRARSPWRRGTRPPAEIRRACRRRSTARRRRRPARRRDRKCPAAGSTAATAASRAR